MKKLLLSRRGAAIELAMAVIFLMMALCIILVSVATLQKSQRQKDLNDLDNKIELWEIGEHVCENRDDYTEETKTEIIIGEQYTGYSVEKDGTTYEIFEGDNVVLTIVIDGDGNITSWN